MTDNLRCIRNYFELSETETANVSVASELQAASATSNGFTNDEICVMSCLHGMIGLFHRVHLSINLSITNDVLLLSFFFSFVLFHVCSTIMCISVRNKDIQFNSTSNLVRGPRYAVTSTVDPPRHATNAT